VLRLRQLFLVLLLDPEPCSWLRPSGHTSPPLSGAKCVCEPHPVDEPRPIKGDTSDLRESDRGHSVGPLAASYGGCDIAAVRQPRVLNAGTFPAPLCSELDRRDAPLSAMQRRPCRGDLHLSHAGLCPGDWPRPSRRGWLWLPRLSVSLLMAARTSSAELAAADCQCKVERLLSWAASGGDRAEDQGAGYAVALARGGDQGQFRVGLFRRVRAVARALNR
jgi:hypothetical protein